MAPPIRDGQVTQHADKASLHYPLVSPLNRHELENSGLLPAVVAAQLSLPKEVARGPCIAQWSTEGDLGRLALPHQIPARSKEMRYLF